MSHDFKDLFWLTKHFIDNTSTNILKKLTLAVTGPISFINNKSVKDEMFPEDLKIDITVPVFKKGDSELVSNYRLLLYCG